MKGSKLFVRNINSSVNNEDLEMLFSDHGKVVLIHVINGKGYGFVEMSNSDEAQRAKEAINGMELKGLNLSVDHPSSDTCQFHV